MNVNDAEMDIKIIEKQYWHKSLLKEVGIQPPEWEKCLLFEQLLPKGWNLNDFSESENLIEIEDRKDGERFWLSPDHIFIHPCSRKSTGAIGLKFYKGQKITVFYRKECMDYVMHRFTGETRRGRYYLGVLFNPIYSTVRPFDFGLLKPDFT